MKLRELKTKDAVLMLEWMHDEVVINDLKTDFLTKKIDECYMFINNSIQKNNINFAIVDENDEYLGTVSLKHITNKNAEFAIVIRKIAMGKNIARDAMREMLEIAFGKLKLTTVFWCVSPKNERAIRFYDKNGYKRAKPCIELIKKWYTEEEIIQYIWYSEQK